MMSDQQLLDQPIPLQPAPRQAPVDHRILDAAGSLDAFLREAVGTAIDAAEDKLGQDGVGFFVGDVLGIADWFVVTSGANNRQVKAIVDNVEEWLFVHHDLRPIRIEGLDSLGWVLMDYGSIIVHVFDHASRSYYDLERLWKDVPRLER